MMSLDLGLSSELSETSPDQTIKAACAELCGTCLDCHLVLVVDQLTSLELKCQNCMCWIGAFEAD